MPDEIKVKFLPKVLIVDDSAFAGISDELLHDAGANMSRRLIEQREVEEFCRLYVAMHPPQYSFFQPGPKWTAALHEAARIVCGGCDHDWKRSDLVAGRSWYCSKCRDWKILPRKGDSPNAR